MPTVKLTVHGLEHDIESTITENLEAAVRRALTACGIEGVRNAVTNMDRYEWVHPTGNLRGSITYHVDGNTVHIGTNVKYAPYVEFGTGNFSSIGGGTTKDHWVYRDELGHYHTAHPMHPRPFLAPAISEHTKDYLAIIEHYLKASK